MKVTISAPGKFHAIYLAEYLSRSNSLHKLIISALGFTRRGKGIERNRVVNLADKAAIQALLSRMPLFNKVLHIETFLSRLFDSRASQYIDPTDIFLGWSGFSLLSLRKAKSLGAITVLERCSTHIEFQKRIMEEEYGILGIAPDLPEKGIIEKELIEYGEADYISVPSNFAKATFLAKNVAPDRLICTAYGVDTQVFRRIPKVDNVFRIVFVGSISARKGVQYLLEAVSRLKLPDLELCLIGGTTGESNVILSKYKGCFKHIGCVDFFDLYKYYSQGSLFVLPSIEEGMAHVILQAMACGLPVICTENSGGGDVVRDGVDGYIVPIRDPGSLMQKISFLYDNPQLLAHMGMEAMLRVKSCFTWDNYGKNIFDTYSKLISQ